MMKTALLTATMVLTIALAGVANARQPIQRQSMAMEEESQPTLNPLEVRDYQGVPYVSGGVGLDERDELMAMTRDYNLKLMFAAKSGNFLSDIDVRVQDPRGRVVLEGVSTGPLFYARLPAGTYRVQVAGFDRNFQQTVQLSGNRQSELGFYWP